MNKPKQRKCRIKAEGCEAEYAPFNSLQRSCYNPKCVLENHRKQEAKKASREAYKQRQEHKKAKERVKTRGEWLKEAQAAFNKYIRLRDRDEPCISCGGTTNDKDLLTGSRWDAGHYRSVGSAPELRFEELNCFKQCVKCNRNLSGNSVNYRVRLIKRIGLGKVEWVESKHHAKKYTIEDIKAIKAKYTKLSRDLEKSLA